MHPLEDADSEVLDVTWRTRCIVVGHNAIRSWSRLQHGGQGSIALAEGLTGIVEGDKYDSSVAAVLDDGAIETCFLTRTPTFFSRSNSLTAVKKPS